MAIDSLEALGWLRKHLEQDDPDLVWDMVKAFAEALMGAEADAICGAGYGERSPERVNSRNGYRHRGYDTRAGTIDLAVPKLREGSYFPGWLLEPRRRAERALTQVVCQCYVEGVPTRRVDDVVKAMGIEGISKSQVSVMAKELLLPTVHSGDSGRPSRSKADTVPDESGQVREQVVPVVAVRL